MGSANPRAFSRNQRGIAGSRVWINFDSPGHALGLGPDPAVDYPGGVRMQLGVSRASVPGDGLLTALEHLRIKTAYLACACEISDP
jgi:hypothetical protein